MRQTKATKKSFATMTEIVMPNDTNPIGNLMGGKMMHWMDMVAAISAQRHCNRVVVTVSVDNVSFKHNIRLGDVVTLTAAVTRAFNSSMEVYIEVYAENIISGTRYKSNEAFYTFVAVDQIGKPIDVPEIITESSEEKERFEKALSRRELRLVLAGRMKMEETAELKKIFGEVKP